MQTTLFLTLVEDIDGNIVAPHSARAMGEIGGQLPAPQARLWEVLAPGDPTSGVPVPYATREEFREQVAKVLEGRAEISSFAVDPLPNSATLRIRAKFREVNPPQDDPELRKAIAAHDSRRWKWDKITAAITGKDADLEDHGQQGVEFVGVQGRYAYCVAHLGGTVCGTEVCLNLPDGADESAARDSYLESAGEIIAGSGLGGEWDGDGWYLTEEIPFRVVLRETPEATAAAIRTKLEQVLAPAEKELRAIHATLGILSGWRDAEGVPCPDGKPSAGSVGYLREVPPHEQEGTLANFDRYIAGDR